ncbi:TPA: hypothetical protein DF272_04555 [Candidatus Falkowbacteria bacterium]|nr:hypothetical protein [Candidatus Falkowbacteria bacterium]
MGRWVVRNGVMVYQTDCQICFIDRNYELFVYGNKPLTFEPFGAEAAMQKVVRIHDFAVARQLLIGGSVDLHFEEDVELKRNKGAFIDHAMNGTVGQLRHHGLNPQRDIYVRAKDGPLMGVRRYTATEMDRIINSGRQIIFEKQTYDVSESNPNFEPILRKLYMHGLRRIVVVGFATDYCVLAAVRAMIKIRDTGCPELEIFVVEDAIEAVNVNFEGQLDNEFGAKAIAWMNDCGVQFVMTEYVIDNLLK